MTRCGLEILALVGLRCTGKSTVGRLVAESTGARFLDLDELAAARLESGSAGEAIERHRLAAFRAAELEALESALERPDPQRLVLATGGGIVETAAARDLLRRSTCAIWLRAPIEILVERAEADATLRPALVEGSLADEFRTLEARRRDLYRDVARRAFDATEAPDQVARRIVSAWLG